MAWRAVDTARNWHFSLVECEMRAQAMGVIKHVGFVQPHSAALPGRRIALQSTSTVRAAARPRRPPRPRAAAGALLDQLSGTGGGLIRRIVVMGSMVDGCR